MTKVFVCIAVIAAIGFTGCKKIALNEQTRPIDDGAIEKLQVWFNKRANNHTASFISGTPAWKAGKYFPSDSMVIVPMEITGDHVIPERKGNCYLAARENSKGEMESGYYYYVLGSRNTDIPAPGFLNATEAPTGFNGAVVTYDLNGNLVSSTHYENGLVVNKQDKIKKTIASNTNGAGNTQTIVPENCDGPTVCIDWYWQTYVNGELVDEEYLFTTCGCENPVPTGGNSGTGSFNELFEEFTNSGHPVSQKISEQIIFEDATHRVKKYEWMFYELNGFGNTKLFSREYGYQEKQPDGKWKFTSMVHNLDWKTSSSTNWILNYHILSTTPVIGYGAYSNWASIKLSTR